MTATEKKMVESEGVVSERCLKILIQEANIPDMSASIKPPEKQNLMDFHKFPFRFVASDLSSGHKRLKLRSAFEATFPSRRCLWRGLRGVPSPDARMRMAAVLSSAAAAACSGNNRSVSKQSLPD